MLGIMIANVCGKVLKKEASALVVSVGGFGIRIRTTPSALNASEEGADISIPAYLAVKEDSLDLYGFADDIEHDLFILLLTLSGVGPKTALDIIGKTTPATIIEAVTEEDPGTLTRLSGLGGKTSEKIVHGLKDKVSSLALKAKIQKGRPADSDVIEAIVALGYSPAEARTAARNVPEEIKDVGERVKHALKSLSAK